MAERDITRNSRGQIISYEILGQSDSTIDTLDYGSVELAAVDSTTGVKDGSSQKYEVGIYRDERDSYSVLIDREISDELRQTFVQPDPALNMGQRLDVFDFEGFFVEPETITAGDGQVVQKLFTATNPPSNPEKFTPLGFRRNVFDGQSSVYQYVFNDTDGLYYEWNDNDNVWDEISAQDTIYGND